MVTLQGANCDKDGDFSNALCIIAVYMITKLKQFLHKSASEFHKIASMKALYI